MKYSDRIKDIKSKTDALTTYANGITGKEDTTLGDAVKSLADGYGGGEYDETKSINITEYNSFDTGLGLINYLISEGYLNESSQYTIVNFKNNTTNKRAGQFAVAFYGSGWMWIVKRVGTILTNSTNHGIDVYPDSTIELKIKYFDNNS